MLHRLLTRLRGSRGQSLVEFSLVVPLLLLLCMVAIDFGRVYLGWVNLQNMARIAANYAANHATEFATGDTATLAIYQQQVLNDAKANNCELPLAGATETAPAPTFSGYDVGDTATVALDCTFNVATPIISNILGSQLTVSASSQFPVKTGIIASSNSGGGGGGGTAVAASFSCTPKSAPVPMPVQCTDESGGNPTSWSWEISQGGVTRFSSTSQDFSFTLTDPGTYDVRLEVDNALNQPDFLLIGGYLTATNGAVVDFTSDTNSGDAPLAVQFTDTSTNSPTGWAWDFDDNGSVDSTQRNPSHTYTQPGTYGVTLTVTNAQGQTSVTKPGYIVVSVPDCTVPSFTGKKRNQAQGLWSGQGFTTQVQDAPGAPNGNGYTITFQSITPGSVVPCDSSILVSG
jgi:PKD repeat protein